MFYNIGDMILKIKGDNHFFADNASIIGDVTLEDYTSVWYNAVIRGDEDSIIIGEGTNIQDGAILHTDKNHKCILGKNVTIGQKAMVHGCTIADNSLIGINSVVMNGAKIGSNCIIGSCALIPEGKEIPDGSLVLGVPGKIIRQTNEKDLIIIKSAAEVYKNKIATYDQKLVRL